ncbi:MAG: hypothetical protein R3F59_18640 [Myxococcota bacterium]
MDALTSVLCLLLGSALPLLGLYFVIRRGVRQLQVATAYGDVARSLASTSTRAASRCRASRRAALVGRRGDGGHGPDRRMACWGVLDPERPLGLGLLIRRRGLSERLYRRARGVKVQAVDAELERLVEISGDEPERVRELLDERVREVLGLILTRWRDLVVTDQSVRIYLSQLLSRTPDLRDLVYGMRTLAAEISAARRRIGPPTALAARAPGWERLGERLGLQVEAAFPGVAGEVDGRTVRVTPVRTVDGGYAAELRIGLRAHRRTGLRLRPQIEPDGYWSVGQDIQVGDEPFDQAFVVKGDDPGGRGSCSGRRCARG